MEAAVAKTVTGGWARIWLESVQKQPLMNNPLNESAEMMFAPERYKTSIHFVFLFLWRGQHGKVRFRLLSWFRRTDKRRVEPTLPQFLEPVVQAPFSSMR
jgi:hypothetical protein